MSKRFVLLFSLLVLFARAPLAVAEEFETIDLPGTYHFHGSALTPDSSRLFVIATTGIVFVYDVETDHYIGAIDLRDHLIRPTSASVARGKLYVQGFRNLAVVDIDSREVLKVISLTPYLGSSYGTVVTAGNCDRVYVVAGSTTDVHAIDTRSDTVVGRVNVGGENTGMGLSPNGRTLFISSSEENRLTIVDTRTMTVTAVVPFYQRHGMSDYTTSVRVSPDGQSVFVAYTDEGMIGRVSVLSRTGEFQKSLNVGQFSTGLEVTHDGRNLVLGCGAVLSPETGETIGEFETSVNGLSVVSVAPDGLRAYVSNVNDTYVKAIEGFRPTLKLDGRPSEGQTLTLSLDFHSEADQLYQLGAALDTNEGIELQDGRVVPVNADNLLRFSVKSENEVFLGFSGRLDENGQAQAEIDLSGQFPGKTIGQTVSICFVTLNTRLARSEVREISNVVQFTLTD